MVGASRLTERYLLRDKLATGGMGTVFIARDERLGRDVAIKLLKESLADDPRFVERFRREARAAGALSHPSIANVFDYGEDDGKPFIVMELVRGRDLAWVLRDESRVPADRAVVIAAQIADALEHAHAAGLIHRDIKPHNVIVSDEGRVKVTDFGIARAIGESTLTATGSVLGTAQYISPEQASGTQVGPASDVYSLGIVLYEMLTGAVPFTGDSALAIAMRHVNDPVPSPSALNPAIPRGLDLVVQRATAKSPGDRFPTAGEMAASLRAVGVGDTDEIDAPTTVAAGTTQEMHLGETWPFPGHPTHWNIQRLGRVVIAVFAVLFLLALAALAYRLTAGSDDPRPPARERDRAPAESPPPEEEPVEAAGIVLEDFTGLPYDEVRTALEAEGIVVDTDPVEAEGFEEGQVVDQSPDPGTEVFEGDTVTLLVNTMPSDDDDDDENGPGKTPKEPPGQTKKDKDDD